MNFFKIIIPAIMGITVMVGTVSAQVQQQQGAEVDSVSDEELKQFVNITQDFQAISQDINNEVENLIEETELDFERFQEIMRSRQNPQMDQEVETTEKEEKIISDIEPQIQKLSQQAQQKQMAAVQENGMTIERFQQIAQAVQSDPQMMQRFQEMATDTTGS